MGPNIRDQLSPPKSLITHAPTETDRYLSDVSSADDRQSKISSAAMMMMSQQSTGGVRQVDYLNYL